MAASSSRAAADKDKGVIARGADVPLALAQGSIARDALVDPREGDFVPDLDDKGLHVGEVRQPAEPVLRAGGDVRFESTSDEPSKFKPTTYAEQVAANAAWEADRPEYAGREHVAVTADYDADREAAARRGEARPAATGGRRARSSGEAAKVEADANATANAQAQQDS